ncbi:hypothetical protein GCM10010984_00510 [Chishuiella changwenlii]|nr:hypothetical protein GCM10010984_00510 [Chishuiella changwenlii]
MFFGFSIFSVDATPMGILGFSMIGIWSLYCLATALPRLAVNVRRLHDTGRSGLFYFIVFIPVIGPILLLIWLVTEGHASENRWGKDPKVLFSDSGHILSNNQNY